MRQGNSLKRSAKAKRIILPFFLTHAGCMGRCQFCDQEAMTGVPARVESSFDDLTARFSSYPQPPDEIAIYGGDILLMESSEIEKILAELKRWALKEMGRIPPVRVSASPRAITREKLLLLGRYNVRTVEVGAVSTDDGVLKRARRGYDSLQAATSVKLSKDMGFATGLQLITGLPGDDLLRFKRSLDDLLPLKPDFAILYPLIVFKGTGLEEEYLSQRFIPHSEGYIRNSAALFLLTCMMWGVHVARIGLFDTDIKQSNVVFRTFPGNLRQEAEGLAYRLMIDYLLVKKRDITSLVIDKRQETSVKGKKGKNLARIIDSHPHLAGNIIFDGSADEIVGLDNEGRAHAVSGDRQDFFDFAVKRLMNSGAS